ncbi:MAG: ABC transporter substrate-binding protein [Candidatus Bathyarchaeota archaeon]|nr:ABC transporter substrate-binding protein [Candidatus Bathyarchaeota archaeon]
MRTNVKVIALILALLIISGSAYGAYNWLNVSSPSPTPSASPSSTASPSASPETPEPSPTGHTMHQTSPTASPSPSPTASPSPTQTATPTPTATSTSTPTSSPTPSPSAEPENKTIIVVDGTGAEVTVSLPVNRIVSLNPGLTELVCAIGYGDQIVGRDESSFFPDSMLDVPIVASSSYNPNLELVIEQKPDLLLADTMLSYNQESLTALQNAGIPVMIELTNNLTQIKQCINNFGLLFDKQAKADEIVDFISSYETIVSERIETLTDSEKPLVYIEWDTVWRSFGEGSGADLNINSVGGINIAAGVSGSSPTLSAEYVVEQNPEVVVLMVDKEAKGNSTAFQAARDEFMSRSVLQDVDVVKNGRVYTYDSVIFQGLRYPVGLLYWAKWFHPTMFADIDPAAVNQEMLEKFFSVTTEEIYAYPEIVTVVDGLGNAVTVTLPVNRIVSINYGITEVLCGLGAEDLIVGRDDLSISPPSVLDIPSVAGTSYSPNMELLLGVQPDLVIADTMLRLKTQEVAAMKAAGITVYIESTGNFTRIKECITNMGKVLDQEQTADELRDYLASYQELVISRIANLTESQKPTVYLEWTDDWQTALTASIAGTMTAAGGINIAEEAGLSSSMGYISPEFVVEQNPDIIIRVVAGTNEGLEPLQTQRNVMLDRAVLGDTTAIQEDKVYTYYNIITQGIRHPIGLLYYATWLHPDLFTDIDPAAVQAELYQRFFGITLDTVYAYP